MGLVRGYCEVMTGNCLLIHLTSGDAAEYLVHQV